SLASNVSYDNCVATLTLSGFSEIGFTVTWADYPEFDGDTEIEVDVAGQYCYTVMGIDACCAAEGCLEVLGELINNVTFTSSVDHSCGQTGSIDIDIVGGNTGYTFDWSSGQSTAEITGLASGHYDVTISSMGGCGTIAGFDVEYQPA